jgi:hypothetical protein
VNALSKPRPIPSRWSRHFWDELRQGRFTLQRCNDCQAFQGYPRVFCVRCYSDNLGWVQACGRGTVYTHTTVVANPPSTFVDELPYTLVIVSLEEGPRFLAQLTGLGAADVECGAAVEIVLPDAGVDLALPAFRLAAHG